MHIFLGVYPDLPCGLPNLPWGLPRSSLWSTQIFLGVYPDLPWGVPSLLYSGYRVSLSGIKRPGCGVDHLPLSTAEVKEKVELYIYSPTRLSFPVLRHTFNFLTFHLRLVPRYTPSLYAFMMSTGLQVYYNTHKYSAKCKDKVHFVSLPALCKAFGEEHAVTFDNKCYRQAGTSPDKNNAKLYLNHKSVRRGRCSRAHC